VQYAASDAASIDAACGSPRSRRLRGGRARRLARKLLFPAAIAHNSRFGVGRRDEPKLCKKRKTAELIKWRRGYE
jgi:hypothetical protein